MPLKNEYLPKLYNISQSIGYTNLVLEDILEESLSSYLRELDCLAGEIFLLETSLDGMNSYEKIYGFQKIVGINGAFQPEMLELPAKFDHETLEKFLARLPFVVENDNAFFTHVMELPNVGLMLLISRDTRISAELLQELKPLNLKLAEVCRICIEHQELLEAYEKVNRFTANLQERNRTLKNTRSDFLKIVNDLQSSTQSLRDWDIDFQKTFDVPDEIHFKIDPEGNILDMNPYISKKTGYAREELIGEPAWQFYFDIEEYFYLSHILRKDSFISDYPVHFKNKNKRLLYATISAQLIYSLEGEILGCEGTLTDLFEWNVNTEKIDHACERLQNQVIQRKIEPDSLEKEAAYRRQAELAVRKTAWMNRQIMKHVNAIFIGIDESDRVSHWNEAAEKATGISRSKVIGLPFLKCGLKWNWDKIVKSISTCIEEEHPVKLKHFIFTRPDQQKGYLNITVNPFLSEKSRISGLFIVAEEESN